MAKRMEKKIKVLYISQKPCLPRIDGGTFAIYSLLRSLSKCNNVDITYAPISTPKHPHAEAQFAEHFKTIRQVTLTLNPNRPSREAFNVFSPIPINVRRYIHNNTIKTLNSLEATSSFDRIICDGLYALSVIPERWLENKNVIYRAHNLEWSHWSQRAAFSSGIKRWFYHKISRKLKSFEEERIKQCLTVLCLSAYEAAYLRDLFNPKTQLLYPTFSYAQVGGVELPNSFYFIGDCSWQPNADAIAYFLQEVWPKILINLPGASLHLAGSYTDRYTQKESQVYGYGFIPDVKAFVSDKQIMISPLRIATGVNIKILENMAMGKPCIATPESTKGLLEPSEIVSIHALDEHFAQACVNASLDSEWLKQYQKKAQEFIETHCNETKQTSQLESLLHER